MKPNANQQNAEFLKQTEQDLRKINGVAVIVLALREVDGTVRACMYREKHTSLAVLRDVMRTGARSLEKLDFTEIEIDDQL